jgi:hypothetical protein
MTSEPKTPVPLQGHPDAANGASEDAAGGGVMLCEAPAGYMLPEGPGAGFCPRCRHPVWLRPGPEDR